MIEVLDVEPKNNKWMLYQSVDDPIQIRIKEDAQYFNHSTKIIGRHWILPKEKILRTLPNTKFKRVLSCKIEKLII